MANNIKKLSYNGIYYGTQDFHKVPLKNARMENATSDPYPAAADNAGMFYWNTASGIMYYSTGTVWRTIPNIALSNVTPQAVVNSTGSAGVSSNVSRDDHVHPLGVHAHTNSTNGGQLSHADLTSLTTGDPHTQYLLKAGGTLTGVVYGVASTDPNALVIYSQLELLATGIKGKTSVRVATTANITLSGIQTIEGVALNVDDRVLVKNQSTQSQNGIYLVKAGAWVRTTDADTWSELVSAFVFVEEGSTLGDTGWLCTVNSGGTLGSTAVTWVQFSSAGVITAANVNTAGIGVYKQKVGNELQFKGVKAGSTKVTVQDSTGDNTISVDVAENQMNIANMTGTLPISRGGTGQTTRGTALMALLGGSPAASLYIKVDAAGNVTYLTAAEVRVDLGIGLSKYAGDLGAITAGNYTTVTHNLNTRDVTVQIIAKVSPYDIVDFDIEAYDANTLRVYSPVAVSSAFYRVIVVG